MPLMKRASTEVDAQVAVVATPNMTTAQTETTAPKAASAAVKARAAKAGNDAPLAKEGYWERKEARDIETGQRIRRSGVWQAALQSLAPLQFNASNTLESYLAVVEKVAEEGLKFVQKD